ncbi:MAG: hypothetical protein J5669_02990 [Bacteroidales bacterium]|nr:hypothetical protein [Bacteroidales bacterium]
MKRVVVICFLVLLSVCAGAQNRRIKVRSFSRSDLGDMRARTAPVLDNNKRLTALVDISIAAGDSTLVFEGIVGQPVSYPGEWMVHVAEGASHLKISLADCKPLDFSYPADMIPESGMVYLMDLDIEEAVKLRTLIMPTLSAALATPTQFSYGLMLGFCKLNGGYLRVKTDFNFSLKTTAECDQEGMLDGTKGWYTGDSKRSRFAVTAGYMRHLFEMGDNASMYTYLGAGYGSRILAWQMRGADGSYQYAQVTPASFKGIEAEAGLIARMGGFVISAGMQTNSFKFWEANLGVGVMF